MARVARTPSRRESPGVETACGVHEHLGFRAQAAAVCRLLGPRQPGTGSARAREAAAASLRTPPPRPRPPRPPAAGTRLSLASEKAPRAPFSPRTRFWTSSNLCHTGALIWSPVSVSEDKGAGPPTGAQAEWLGTRPVSTLLHQPAAPAGTLGPRGRGVSAPGCCDKVPGLGAPNDGDIVSHEPEARGAVGDAVSPGVSPASWGLAGTSVVLRLVDASPDLRLRLHVPFSLCA